MGRMIGSIGFQAPKVELNRCDRPYPATEMQIERTDLHWAKSAR